MTPNLEESTFRGKKIKDMNRKELLEMTEWFSTQWRNELNRAQELQNELFEHNIHILL